MCNEAQKKAHSGQLRAKRKFCDIRQGASIGSMYPHASHLSSPQNSPSQKNIKLAEVQGIGLSSGPYAVGGMLCLEQMPGVVVC